MWNVCRLAAKFVEMSPVGVGIIRGGISTERVPVEGFRSVGWKCVVVKLLPEMLPSLLESLLAPPPCSVMYDMREGQLLVRFSPVPPRLVDARGMVSRLLILGGGGNISQTG